MTGVDWVGRMVTPAVDLVAPVFRRTVAYDAGHGAPTSATLHVSSRGVHECSVDGTAVSDEVLAPGWSASEWRLRYRSHDVLDLLHDGSVLTVALGNGWWRGRLGFLGGRALYGDRLGLVAQLVLVFADGHTQVIGTDPSWSAGPSDTIADDLYDGQTVDARRRDPDWNDQFLPVELVDDFDPAVLAPYVGPPVVRHEALRPTRVWSSPSGATPLRSDALIGMVLASDAQATDRFILSGGLDSFEPTFTFHGFRYAEVSGPLDATTLEAVVVHSDLRRTGTFECSDPLLTQLHRNVVWGLRGTVLGPTRTPRLTPLTTTVTTPAAADPAGLRRDLHDVEQTLLRGRVAEALGFAFRRPGGERAGNLA